MVSPERYAGEAEQKIEKAALVGNWQLIVQDKNDNKIIPSVQYEFTSSGKVKNEKQLGKWELTGDNKITVKIPNDKGEEVEYTGKVIASWDWENKKQTLVFTAIDKNGVSLWGKLV